MSKSEKRVTDAEWLEQVRSLFVSTSSTDEEDAAPGARPYLPQPGDWLRSVTDRIGELPEPTGKQAQQLRTRLLGALNSARRGGDATRARTIRETLKTAWNYTDATSVIADLGDLLS